MSLIGNFIRVDEELWLNLDHVTSVRDRSKDEGAKGKTFKLTVWTSDNPQGEAYIGIDALNIMAALGLPWRISVDDQ